MSNARNDKFRHRVINEPLGSNIVSEPTNYTMQDKIITSLDVTNIRNDYNGHSDELIVLNKGTELTVRISDKPLWFGIGWSWYRVEYDTKVWYVADTNTNGAKSNLIIKDIVPDETPDEPDTPDTPIDNSTLADLVGNAVSARFEAYEARIAELEATIERLVEPVIVGVPDVSYAVPRFAPSMLGSMYAGLERVNKVQKDFIQGSLTEPTLTASQIADIGFKASSSSDWFDDSGNISITNTDEDTILDTMLNGDDTETDADLPIAS